MRFFTFRKIILLVILTFAVILFINFHTSRNDTIKPTRVGYSLGETNNLQLWWVEGSYKVKKHDLPGEYKPIKIYVARREYEPFQLVIRSTRDKKVGVKITDLASKDGKIGRENIAVYRQEYLHVKIPTDNPAWRGYYPDPLLPLDGKLNLVRGQNNPLWVSVYVPPDTPAGMYRGSILLDNDKIPFFVRVWDFTLTEETHTPTAYGLAVRKKWHGVSKKEDLRKIYELYLENFSRHRVSPYDPMRYYPTEELSSTEFYKAYRSCLEKYNFNRFNFPISRDGTITTDYIRRVGDLRELVSKAYCYWEDEPTVREYPRVKKVMAKIKQKCPDVKRLLTSCEGLMPSSQLRGHVDIWTPQLDKLDLRPGVIQDAKKRGEEIWWYVCTGPKYPFPNNFIDHPAVEIRIRYWMMERFGVQGDLYYATTSWGRTNPYEDPMRYKSVPGQYWGNGDGYLLYPPSREKPDSPLIKAPINSIRWELIRDGLEDREYFWLLRQMCKKYPHHPAIVLHAREGLKLPGKLIRTPVHFERDYTKIEKARIKLGFLLEYAHRQMGYDKFPARE